MTGSLVFFQTAYLGDVLLTLPALYRYKQEHPGTSISYVCLKAMKPLLDCYPFIDHVVPISKNMYRHPWNWPALKRLIKSDGPVTLVSAARSLSSRIFFSTVACQQSAGWKGGPASWLLTHAVARDQSQPELARIFELLQSVGGCAPDLPWKDKLPLSCEKTSLVLPRNPYVVLAPGSRWSTKRWPLESFAETARKIEAHGLDVVWTGLSGEIVRPERLKGETYNLIDKTPLPVWIDVINRARLVIANDSATTQAAVIHGIPALSIFGSTSEAFGYAPVGERSAAVSVDLPCRPCGSHGAMICPLGHHQCMELIRPDAVFETARSL